MPDKSFTGRVPFRQFPDGSLPIIEVGISAVGARKTVRVPLLFDTGASATILRRDAYPLLALADWNVGVAEPEETAGGRTMVYPYDGEVELFGRRIRTRIKLTDGITRRAPFVGLLGRADVFRQFGFGFWESSQELLYTLTP